MTPFQQWRMERNAKIAVLYRAGGRPVTIAEAIPCGITTVYAVLAGKSVPRGHKLDNIPLRKRSHKPEPKISNPTGWWAYSGREEALTSLWNQGFTALQIARHLKCTRNAVIGKAHRLNLQARPSPIKRAA